MGSDRYDIIFQSPYVLLSSGVPADVKYLSVAISFGSEIMRVTTVLIRYLKVLVRALAARPVSSSTYLLGVLLLVLGFAMPWYLHQQAIASSTSISSGSSTVPIQGCGGESSNTFTAGNLTHTAVSVRPCDTLIWSDQMVRSYGPGPESLSLAQSSIFTTLSIVASVGLAVITMSLQNERFRNIGRLVLFPSVCALWLLSLAISIAVYDSLREPLAGLPPSIVLVELSFAMTLFGFGSSMFALAGALRKGGF
jgi:hypothetical protein